MSIALQSPGENRALTYRRAGALCIEGMIGALSIWTVVPRRVG